jgi:hypothetical protein
MGLDKVNAFLKASKQNENEIVADVIMNGSDTVKNILVNETIKINRLEKLTNSLLNYIGDEKAIKRLSYKDQQELLKTVSTIQNSSRDFIFKVAELSAKNEFIKKVLEVTNKPNEIVTSKIGESYVTALDEETRKSLTEVLRDMVNEKIRNS